MSSNQTNCQAGWLQKIYLDRATTDKSAAGFHNGKEVLVFGGNYHLKEYCLARLSPRGDERIRLPRMNFITSEIPKDFEEMGPEEYIFTGIWTPEMNKSNRIPSFNDTQRYFEVGSRKSCFYIKGDSNKSRGRFRININSFTPRKASFSQIVRKKLPDPHEQSRLVIVETQDHLEDLTAAIEDQGLSAIHVEPRRY